MPKLHVLCDSSNVLPSVASSMYEWKAILTLVMIELRVPAGSAD